jgi:hypothetical protein
MNVSRTNIPEAVFRIRIHFFRIRIQRLRLETNTDPDPDSEIEILQKILTAVSQAVFYSMVSTNSPTTCHFKVIVICNRTSAVDSDRPGFSGSGSRNAKWHTQKFKNFTFL